MVDFSNYEKYNNNYYPPPYQDLWLRIDFGYVDINIDPVTARENLFAFATKSRNGTSQDTISAFTASVYAEANQPGAVSFVTAYDTLITYMDSITGNLSLKIRMSDYQQFLWDYVWLLDNDIMVGSHNINIPAGNMPSLISPIGIYSLSVKGVDDIDEMFRNIKMYWEWE